MKTNALLAMNQLTRELSKLLIVFAKLDYKKFQAQQSVHVFELKIILNLGPMIHAKIEGNICICEDGYFNSGITQEISC